MSDVIVATDTVPFDPCSQPSLTADAFRAMFPAFSDPAAYPDATINLWISLAPLDPCLWDKWYNLGQGLWAAHEMTKFGPANAVPPGSGAMSSGPITSKGVGPVSVSYDTNIGSEEGAGQYNTTIYGRQFYHWAMIFGAGPIQIGPATRQPYGVSAAWIGPPPFPGVFG